MNRGLPQINLNCLINEEVRPIQQFLQEAQDTIPEVDKTQWKDQYQIVSMSVPDIADFPTIKKKFKIQIVVLDPLTKKTFGKTIFFGNQGDYVFTKDKNSRIKKLASLRNMKNPLHADYWRAHVCLTGQDWIQNSLRVIRYYLQHKEKMLDNLRPKADFATFIKKREHTLKSKNYK